MSKYTLKSHKGTVIFSSVVAGAALAPMVNGQLQDEGLDQSLNGMHLPLSTSQSAEEHKLMQGIPLTSQTLHSIDKSSNQLNKHLSASTYHTRITAAEKKAFIKNSPPLRLVSKDETEESSSTMQSVWPEDTLIQLGDEGPKVKTIQKHLSEVGYYVYTVDGKFGPKTQRAVKMYQKDNGLKIDGIVGLETANQLIGMKQVITAETTRFGDNLDDPEIAVYTPYDFDQAIYIKQTSLDLIEKPDSFDTRGYFKYGDNDERVMGIQEKLQRAGYYSGPIDGIYGSSTQQAVRLLQREQRLSVDGLAGSQVISFLDSADLKKIAEERVAAEREAAKQKQTKTASKNTNKETGSSSTSSSSTMEQIISKAHQLIGTPYVWGGTSPSGFDCSGFLVYLFNQVDMSLPRTVSDIWNATSSVSSPQRGDIVFFETYKKGPSHAGIYLGDGAFIHTGSNSGVTISYLNESYWSSRYLGARRH